MANRIAGPCRAALASLALFGCLFVAVDLSAQGKPKTPSVSADVGTCSAGFVVQNGQRKPLYDAKVSLTFRYGFLNLHKASLEAFTDSEGRARFDGLPNESKKPLAFVVRYGDRQKTLTDDPLTTCKATYHVVLP
jgi:hypothetical protein